MKKESCNNIHLVSFLIIEFVLFFQRYFYIIQRIGKWEYFFHENCNIEIKIRNYLVYLMVQFPLYNIADIIDPFYLIPKQVGNIRTKNKGWKWDNVHVFYVLFSIVILKTNLFIYFTFKIFFNLNHFIHFLTYSLYIFKLNPPTIHLSRGID